MNLFNWHIITNEDLTNLTTELYEKALAQGFKIGYTMGQVEAGNDLYAILLGMESVSDPLVLKQAQIILEQKGKE